MSAKFYQRQVSVSTGNKFNTKFYIVNPSDLCIEPAGASAFEWAKSGAFGTNASFYTKQKNGIYYMTALHIFRNKNMGNYSSEVEGGNNNTEDISNPSTALDFLYYDKINNKVDVMAKTPSWTTSNNRGIPNMEWGIGGFNVLADKTFSNETSFINGFKSYYPNLIDGKLLVSTSRTAIGIRNDNTIILVALFGPDMNNPDMRGPKMYEVHLLMKYFGCKKALCLDGSNCTKISYKTTGGTPTAIDPDSRATHCRIRLTVAAANSCNWSGK